MIPLSYILERMYNATCFAPGYAILIQPELHERLMQSKSALIHTNPYERFLTLLIIVDSTIESYFEVMRYEPTSTRVLSGKQVKTSKSNCQSDRP